jgi:hypothetical protein
MFDSLIPSDTDADPQTREKNADTAAREGLARARAILQGSPRGLIL